MADMQTLYRALQNAHAAGDVQAATQLATYIKSMQEQPQAAPEEPGFFGGAKAAAVRGLESVPESASGIGLGIKAALGMRESASKQAEDIRAQAKAEEGKPQGVSFADLEKAYQEQGLLAAAKKLPSYVTEQALQSAPGMAVPLAAGAGAAAFAGPLAPVVGPAVGIGTYGLQQFGNFMRRQAEEGATGDTLAPAKAFGTAAVTAPIGYFADKLTLGLGNIPEKILGKEIAAELAKRAGVRAATGATVGVVAEAPTEVLEQMGERWQAGLPLKGEDAMREYKEAFFGAAAIGGVGGAAAGALRKPAVTPKEEPPAYQPPVSLTGKTPAEMFQEQAAGRQGMGADVMGAVREREAAAAKAKQDELDAQRATQERAAGLFEQQAAPRNEDLMQAARVREQDQAAADEEARVKAEKEAKAKRDAEAKAAAAATYSSDPAMNAIRRDEQLATLGYQMSRDKQGNDIVIPTPPAGRDIAAERAAQEAKIAEGRRADEVRQSLAGTTANEDLMASIRQRQADQAAAAAKAEQDKKAAEAKDVAAQVRGIMVTEYSRDPIMNNVRQREALGELGYELKLDKKGNLTPQPKPKAAVTTPAVTPTSLTLEKPPEKPPVTMTPEVREEYPKLTQAEVDELGLTPPAKVVTPKEPKVDYFNHPDNIGHDASAKRELDEKGKLAVAPQPVTEGGVPFKSRKSADMARKNYPDMRILPTKDKKGFILAPKTPKQIAADEAKAKRLSQAKTSATGTPMSAHEYITSEGGIVKTEMSDLGMDKNVRVGNRFLFAGDGKGLTMEEAYTKLQEAGYLGENATQNDARNMITDSVKKPKYRPQDEEAMAKRDEEKRFEDYRKAEEEASLYSPVDEELGYEMSDFDGTGYEAADPDVQAEVRALLAQADELGIDTESMREEVFYETETQSVQAYYKAFKSALEGAIARSREDSVQDTGQPSDAGAELTLTQPSVEEIVAKQDAAIKAEKDRQAAERAAEEQAQADEAAADFTLTGSDRDADVAASRGQKDIFAEKDAFNPVALGEEFPEIGAETFAYLDTTDDEVRKTIGKLYKDGDIDGAINALENLPKNLAVIEKPKKAPPKLKPPEGFKLKENRNEQVVLAARELEAGRITKEQFDEYVDFYMPIGTVPNPERPMSQSDMKLVLQTNQISKMNTPIADGTPVGLRMDINALGRAKSQGLTGSVVAIHPENNPNSPISYSSAARIQNVRFSIRNQKAAMKVATQAEPTISKSGNVTPQGNKSPQQTMEGNWVNITPEEAYAMVQRLLKDKAWSQVSFDPLRHSYFYDRATKQPVIAADDVIQVGRFVLAKNVQYSDRGEFLYMLRDATPEQISLVDAGAAQYNGQTVWQRGPLALVRGWNKRTGAPVYVAVKGNTINRYDIDEKMGEHLLTSAEIKELRQVKADLEAADAKAEAENPFIKFNKDGLAFSKNLPPRIAGVAKGWKEQLGLTNNIYITTTPDARVDAHNMTGQWRAVGSAALDYREAGSVRQMPNGDYYIAMQPSSSISKMLETLSHEMGHIHMYEVFNKAPAETQASIKAEYDKWVASTEGKTARELVDSLRAKTSAQTTKIEEGLTAAKMDPYWKLFKEWYADQVSRWAVTSDKPLGVVEQFFKRLADSMRAFYMKVKNAGYLPNETFKKYLEAANEAAQKSKDMTVPPIIAEDAQMEMFMLKSAGQTAAKVASTVKAAAQQKLQKREPINREALSDMDADYVEKLGAVFNPQTKTIIDRIAGLKDGFWRRAAQGIADQYRTIKDYSEEAYMMARLSKTVDGALEGLLMHGHVFNNGGALDIKGQTKGLFEAMKPVGAETDRYMMWIALGRESRLPIDKRSPNLAPLLADRDQLVQGDINGRPRLEVYQEVQKDMNALNKSVLDVAYNAGLMDQKAYERFSQDLFYIPFYKQMESGDLQDAATASGLTSQKFSAELKGQSDKPFGDLMENTLRNWSHILSASMKNQASNATLDAAMEAGAAIPNLKVGLSWEDGQVVSSKTGEVVGDGSLRPEYMESGKGTVKTMINGQPAYFEVLDPMLLDSITSIGYLGPKSKFLDVARDFKNLLQYGVTIAPGFKVNNLIRDSIQALAVSDLKRNPFANVIDGWAATDKNNPAHISALAGGAIFNFGSAYEGDQSKLVKRLLAQGVKSEHILDTDEKIKAGLKTAWDKYQEWGNKSEAANRMALYNQMRERKLTHLQASFAARDLLDFSMQGSWPAFRLVTQVVPFMNARVQGLYKLGRDGVTPTARVLYNTVTGKPIEQTDKQKAEAFGYTTLAVAGASMALYMIFKDDEDYKKRDEWDRDNFWWFKLPGMDFAFRVPKPFEIGAFGTMAERTLEQIIDQEAEGKQFGDSIKRMLGDTFALNPVPQMFKPVLDLYANKDSFTGAPIESAGMERLSKQERAADTTSPLAIALGGMTTILGEKGELSPVQVDYAIKAYFGWLGSTAAVTSQYAVMPFRDGEYPDAKWLDRASLGLIKSLPSNQSRYATAFYENNRQISQAFADMRHYAESNQTDKVIEIMEEKGDKIALAKLYDQTSKKMAAVRKQIREVNANEGLSGSDKREEIDRLKELIGMYAEQAESVRKSIK
ncbi:hypothetical protein CCP3SC15_260005 [Gammaproteobacteria bacterium]